MGPGAQQHHSHGGQPAELRGIARPGAAMEASSGPTGMGDAKAPCCHGHKGEPRVCLCGAAHPQGRGAVGSQRDPQASLWHVCGQPPQPTCMDSPHPLGHPRSQCCPCPTAACCCPCVSLPSRRPAGPATEAAKQERGRTSSVCLLLLCFHFPTSGAAAAGPWPSALRAGAKPQGRAVPAASPGIPGPPAREGLRGGFVPAPVLGTEGLWITQRSIRCCRPERGNGTLHYDVTMTGPRMSQTGPAGGVSSHGHSGPHSS